MDLYHDPAFALLAHLKPLYPGLHEMMKTAQFEDSADKIPSSAFAWGERRMFPIHTPAHAAISFIYAKHASEMRKEAAGGRMTPLVPKAVMDQIKEALDAYSIPMSVFEQSATKVASEEETLFPNRTYPVRNVEEVKLAAARLFDQLPKLRLETRVPALRKLASAAERHGVDLPVDVYRMGGMARTNPDTLASVLHARAQMCKVAEVRQTFIDLANSVQTQPRKLEDNVVRSKLAKIIHDLDQEANLTRFYNQRIPDAVATVYNGSKVASDDIDLCGSYVNPSQLHRLPTSFFSDALGPDVLDHIAPGGALDTQKVAELLATLPAPMKQDFARHLSAAGIPLG